jgi:DNA-binding response OmpR family regulator
MSSAQSGTTMGEEPLLVGDLRIDAAAHKVTIGGRPLELAPREFALLLALARRAEQVISVDELIRLVWGDGFSGEPQVVYVHVRRLREKLEIDPAAPTRLLTVRGVGYKLALTPAGAAHADGR